MTPIPRRLLESFSLLMTLGELRRILGARLSPEASKQASATLKMVRCMM